MAYYNRFTPEKGWKDIRFQAGSHLQSAELNEMQSIQQDNTRLLASTAIGLKSGSITRGMSFLSIDTLSRSDIPWTRNGTTATFMLDNHILDIDDIITVTDSSSTAAITEATHVITAISDGFFSIACNNAGATTGTCSFTQTKSPNQIAQIDPGVVHMGGIFHTFAGGVVEITGIGDETIGMIFTSKEITEIDDPDLNDPAIGHDPGYGLPGAYRTVYDLTLVVDDPNAIPIYKLRDGVVWVAPVTDPYEPIYNILARRTNDESGSYMVWGLGCNVRSKDASYFNLDVSPGKAYVQGWEWTIPATTSISIRRPLDADSAPNETHLFSPGLQSATIKTGGTAYEVDDILTVETGTGGTFKVTSVAPITGAVTGIELVSAGTGYNNVDGAAVTSAPVHSPAAADCTLITVCDYTIPVYMAPLKEIDSVDVIIATTTTITPKGAPGGADTILNLSIGAVVGGSVSNVNYAGNNYSVGTHYTVTGNTISWAPGGTGVTEEPASGATYNISYQYIRTYVPTTDYTFDENGIDIANAAIKPLMGSTVLISYKPYLERYDTVAMNARGEFSVIEGIPDYYQSGQHYAYPPVISKDLLKIADVYYPPNADPEDCVVTKSNSYRKTMHEINNMSERIKSLEYNIAVTDLENTAFNIGLASSKKAIFTDGFADLNKVDLGHALVISNPPSIDFNRTLQPGNLFAFHSLTGQTGRLSLPSSHTLSISQVGVTESQMVNPYAVFSSATILTLDPKDDLRINSTTINVNTNEVAWFGSSLWSRWWEESNRPDSLWVANRARTTFTQEIHTVTDTQVLGVSVEKTVSITGQGFLPNSDSLLLTFDGTPYNLTPTGTTQAGTPVSGTTTVKSNSAGVFTATFDVPAGIIGGDKYIVVYNANNSGQANYSIGTTNRVIIDSIRIRNAWQVMQVSNIDPVAQTFNLNDTQLISGVDLFFTAKDPLLPVRVTIQNVVNGYPGPNVLAEALIPAESVAISDHGTLSTQVRFTQHALCERNNEYCIVIASNSDLYQIAIARLGHNDLVTGKTVSKNPFSGVMFTSSNASTWSPDQTADIKFSLYRAHCTSLTETFTYDALTVDGNYFCLFSNSEIPEGCSVFWSYSANGLPWRTCLPGVTITPGVRMTSLALKVTITGTPFMSPLVGDNIVVLVGYHVTEGEYISRNTNLTDLGSSAFDTLDIYLDQLTPGTSSIEVFYATDGTGTSWTTAGTGTAVTSLADGFTQMHYNVSGISGSPTDMRLRIKMTATEDELSVPQARRAMMIASLA